MLPTMLMTFIIALLTHTIQVGSQAMGGPGGPSFYSQGSLLNIAQINVLPPYSYLSANWTSQNNSDVFINQDSNCRAPLPFLTTEPTNTSSGRTPIAFAADRWSVHDATSPISMIFDGHGVSADWYIDQYIVYSDTAPQGFTACNLSATQQKLHIKNSTAQPASDCEVVTLFAYSTTKPDSPFDCSDPSNPC